MQSGKRVLRHALSHTSVPTLLLTAGIVCYRPCLPQAASFVMHDAGAEVIKPEPGQGVQNRHVSKLSVPDRCSTTTEHCARHPVIKRCISTKRQGVAKKANKHQDGQCLGSGRPRLIDRQAVVIQVAPLLVQRVAGLVDRACQALPRRSIPSETGALRSRSLQCSQENRLVSTLNTGMPGSARELSSLT